MGNDTVQNLWIGFKPVVKTTLETVVLPEVVKALETVIAKSENKIDDMVWAALKADFIKELKNQISHI